MDVPAKPPATRPAPPAARPDFEQTAEETIPIGGAGLIVAYPHKAAGKVEPAVTRAIKHEVGEAEGHHVKALKGALAEAQQKMAAEGG